MRPSPFVVFIFSLFNVFLAGVLDTSDARQQELGADPLLVPQKFSAVQQSV